jgi:hypothetical protein
VLFPTVSFFPAPSGARETYPFFLGLAVSNLDFKTKQEVLKVWLAGMNTAALVSSRPPLQRNGTTLFGPNGDPPVIPQTESNAEAEAN